MLRLHTCAHHLIRCTFSLAHWGKYLRQIHIEASSSQTRHCCWLRLVIWFHNMLVSGDLRHICKYISRVHRKPSEEKKPSSRRYNQHMLKTKYAVLVWRRQAAAAKDHAGCLHASEILRWTSVKIPGIQILFSSPADLYKLTMECLRWAQGCSHERVWTGSKWGGVRTVVFKPPLPLRTPKRRSWWLNRDQSLIFSERILPSEGNFPDASGKDFRNMKIQKQIMGGILRIKLHEEAKFQFVEFSLLSKLHSAVYRAPFPFSRNNIWIKALMTGDVLRWWGRGARGAQTGTYATTRFKTCHCAETSRIISSLFFFFFERWTWWQCTSAVAEHRHSFPFSLKDIS